MKICGQLCRSTVVSLWLEVGIWFADEQSDDDQCQPPVTLLQAGSPCIGLSFRFGTFPTVDGWVSRKTAEAASRHSHSYAQPM